MVPQIRTIVGMSACSSFGLALALAAAPRPPLPRLALNIRPAALARLQLHAVETWSEPGHTPERETDEVSFYHGVPIEVQLTEAGHPLAAEDEARQRRAAARIRGKIDCVSHGDASDGLLVNLNGEIWTMPQFEADFDWTEHAAGDRNILNFTPRAGLHPASRMEKVLAHTAGTLEVDAASGQILSGSFRSVGPVSFGAGLLARIRRFEGSFEMQPVGSGAEQTWVMRRVTVSVDGRKLFHRIHGTETMEYTVAK